MRRKSIIKTIATFSLCCILLNSCKKETEENTAELPPDFIEFYETFHADPEFQMTRISFPLPGKETAGLTDSTGSDGYWLESEWVVHKRFTKDAEFTRQIDVLSPEMIIETIRHRTSPYAIQRRFALMADGWNLVYYRELAVPDTAQ